MVRAGDRLTWGKQRGTVGAVLPLRRCTLGVTAAHLFSGRDVIGTLLQAGDVEGRLVRLVREFDLAYFTIPAGQPTDLGDPCFGEAILASELGQRPCRISDIYWSLCMIVLRPRDLPGPGESGAPLLQGSRVVGILSSINLNTCKGTVVSSQVIRKAMPGV